MTNRVPGVEGAPGRPVANMNDGTNGPVSNAAPGIVGILKTAAVDAGVLVVGGPVTLVAYEFAKWHHSKNLDSLAEVRDRALVLAPAAVAKETGFNDLGKLLGEVLYGLLGMMIALAASAALGGVIGGVIGAFFGVVGAAPGAVAGAKIGFELGLAILTWIGVGFLAASIAQGFGELTSLLTTAIQRGWAAGDKKNPQRAADIEQAAEDLAKAVGVLIRLILEAIIAYILRKAPMATARNAARTVGVARTAGANAVAAEAVAELVAKLRASRLGSGFADWVEANWESLLKNPKLSRTAPPATIPEQPPLEKTPPQAKQPSAEKPPKEKTGKAQDRPKTIEELRKDPRFEELSKDPQTLETNAKSQKEAEAILQAEQKYPEIKNPRRPNLGKGEPNLDFKTDDGWVDVKSPESSKYRSLSQQASDIAEKSNLYDQDVKVVLDLNKVAEAQRGEFMKAFADAGGDSSKIFRVP